MLSIVSRFILFFFFKQKTAYEMRISDWSSDVCSSDLPVHDAEHVERAVEDFGVQRGQLRQGQIAVGAAKIEVELKASHGLASSFRNADSIDRKRTRLNSSH